MREEYPKEKDFGYPAKTFTFSGDFFYGMAGSWNCANRNRKPYRMPIYTHPEERDIADGEQQEWLDRTSPEWQSYINNNESEGA